MRKPSKSVPRTGVGAAELRWIALSFPGAIEATSYGKPSYLVVKKFFTRLRAEDNSIVLIVGSMDERDMLLESDPALFHITEHYRNHPSVLVRMEMLDAVTLHGMLERRWRAIAPKKLLTGSDATASTPAMNKR